MLKPDSARDLSLYAIDRLKAGAPVVVLTEGEPAADALLAGSVPAVATVTGASTYPGDRALRELVTAAPTRVICWPDLDVIGNRHMMQVRAALTRIQPGLRVDILNPTALGLTQKGDDAADWMPGKGTDVISAILEAADTPLIPARYVEEDVSDTVSDAHQERIGDVPERRIWLSWDEVEARPVTSPVILPGLAWEGESSILVGDSKTGKSTLMSQALASMALGREFLGSPVGTGRVGILEEMGANRLKGWLEERGVKQWSDVDFLEPCNFADLRAYLGERKPRLLVIDTLALLATLNQVDENAAADMRTLALHCKAHGGAVLVIHHENRQGEYRGSSDIRAAIDMFISMKRGEGGLRTLSYLGRWPQKDLTLTFTLPTMEYTIAEGDQHSVELLNYVANHPGQTRHAVAKEIGINRNRVYVLLNKAVADGVLVDTQGMLYVAVAEPDGA